MEMTTVMLKPVRSLCLIVALVPAPMLGQELVPDVDRLSLGADTLTIYMVSGVDTSAAGYVIDELSFGNYHDTPAIIRVYRSESTILGSRSDTLIDARATFEPIAVKSWTERGAEQLEFGSGRVKGTIWIADGSAIEVDEELPAGAINAASFDLVLRASDLGAGAEYELRAFVAPIRTVLTLRAHVSGMEEVAGHQCWRVEVEAAGMPVTFWISEADRRLVRQKMVIRPDAFILFDLPARFETEPPISTSYHAPGADAVRIMDQQLRSRQPPIPICHLPVTSRARQPV